MPDVRVVVVGAGMSGLCLGIKLKDAGFDDFTILEKASDVGGTWRENRYPGLSCDVPSRYYSYSFELNPEWSSWQSPGEEIWRYFQRVTDRYGLRPHIRFGAEVAGAEWDDGRWRVRTTAGDELEAEVLVSATGVLHHPRVPDLPGLDTFAGAAFHSARWDHDVPLDGARIGVIGSGSTGIQIVSELAGRAGRLVHFQRTPQWVLPLPNRRYMRATRALFRRSPRLTRLAHDSYQRIFEGFFGRATIRPGWQRTLIGALVRANLRSVRDPELRRKLTPAYEPMCKRLVMSGRFYKAVQQPNVEVVREGIERVEPAGVRTADGVLHELDVLVLATGFDAHAFMRPMDLVGEGGRRLSEEWRGEPHAYLTVALPGYPNFFMIQGPHSPFGNQSLVTVAETQAGYIVQWLRRLRSGEVRAVSPRPEPTDAYNDAMRAALPETIWVSGCSSWYIGKDGLPTLWPWTPEHHRTLLAEPRTEEFVLKR